MEHKDQTSPSSTQAPAPIADGGGSTSSTSASRGPNLRGLDFAAQEAALTPREQAPVQRKPKGDSQSTGADAAEQCYLPGEIQVAVECGPGGQEALNAQAAKGDEEQLERVAASVAWEGPLGVRLMGFDVGKSSLSGTHKQALEQLRTKIKGQLALDPRIIAAASADALPGDEPPWWEAIKTVAGSASPEGKEDQNANLAMDRAASADAGLLALGAGRWDTYKPRLNAEPQRDKKTPKAQWPALRSATVRADVGGQILKDFVVPPADLEAEAGETMRAAVPEPHATTPTPSRSAPGKRQIDKDKDAHEFKGGAKPKSAKTGHELGVTFSADGVEAAYKRTLDKSWPFPTPVPGVFIEVTVGGALGGACTIGPGTAEGALTGELSAACTVNGGIPNVASIYAGGGGKLGMKGSFTYDARTRETNGKAKGALTVEAKIGAKAQVGVPKDWLPAGWDALEAGLQYEYKPGGEWELAVVDWDEGEITFTEGKDLAAMREVISKFANGLQTASKAAAEHLGNSRPLENKREYFGTGSGGMGGRNLE